MDNLRGQSLRFAALTTSLYTREAWGLAGRGERVRGGDLPRKEAANCKVFADRPHSSPSSEEGTGVVVRHSALQRGRR